MSNDVKNVMVFRKSEDPKVTRKMCIITLTVIVSFITAIVLLVASIKETSVYRLIGCAFMISICLFVTKYVGKGLLNEISNQSFILEVHGNFLVYNGIGLKHFKLPVCVLFFGSEILICNKEDRDNVSIHDKNIDSNSLILKYDTVDDDGQKLIEFLSEANSQFLGIKKEVP